LVGEKVAIVSPKPQTTRDAILGVLTKEDYQLVFVDTPGIYKAHNVLSDVMMKTTETTARGVDLILFVHDGHAGITDSDIELIKRYSSGNIPMVIAYTKIDIMRKENIVADAKKLYDSGVECDVFPVSARKYTNIKKLEAELAARMPQGDKVIEDDIVSDKSERFMIAEIMREKILLKYDQEIPHGVAIVVNTFKKQDNGVYDINLDIVCEKANHKAILIGKQGKAIKEVSSFARQDMEEFLGAKVFLTTYVKVKEDWRDRPGLVKDYGYDTKKGNL
jgi:GTP-binding protein Era